MQSKQTAINTWALGLSVFSWLMTFSTPTAAKTTGEESAPYLSGQTTALGQARANQLTEGAGLNGAERRLSIGLKRCVRPHHCRSLALDYQYTRYEFVEIDSRDRDLHRLRLPVTWTRASEHRRLTANLTPGIATSSNVMKDFLNRGGSDDLFLHGQLESQPMTNRWGPVLGVRYDRRFGKSQFTPVLGLELSRSPDTRLRLAFPESAIEVRVSDRHHFSWRLYPSGYVWHVVTDNFQNEFDYRVKGYRSEIGWQARLTRHVSLNIRGGIEMARRHIFKDDALATIDTKVDDTWSFGVELRIRADRL